MGHTVQIARSLPEVEKLDLKRLSLHTNLFDFCEPKGLDNSLYLCSRYKAFSDCIAMPVMSKEKQTRPGKYIKAFLL